jgi:hypothetical protein
LRNWSRHHWLRSEYAPSLLLEAALLLVFGLMGAPLSRQTPFVKKAADGVLVPAFTMACKCAG